MREEEATKHNDDSNKIKKERKEKNGEGQIEKGRTTPTWQLTILSSLIVKFQSVTWATGHFIHRLLFLLLRRRTVVSFVCLFFWGFFLVMDSSPWIRSLSQFFFIKLASFPTFFEVSEGLVFFLPGFANFTAFTGFPGLLNCYWAVMEFSCSFFCTFFSLGFF